MRIAWRSVGAIVARVCADVDAVSDRFAGLRRIGIDEISYKKGHKYLTIVVDHDSGLLVWAAEGHDAKTLGKFFTLLREQLCQLITHVSAEAVDWVASSVERYSPHAAFCSCPFPVIMLATAARQQC